MPESLLAEVRKRLGGYFNGFMPGVWHSSEDVIKHINHVLDAIETEIKIEADVVAATAGADYWVEVPAHLPGEAWYADTLAKAGLELLYIGPRGSVSAYVKVRDPQAPAELMHRTVQLHVDMVVVDPNASPPTYSYQIIERRDMNS